MGLRDDRTQFSILVSELVIWINQQEGYQAAYDTLKRTPAEQEVAVEQGSSKTKNSKHLLALAADIIVWKDGVYLTQTPDYKFVGEKWKSMNPNCIWGGDWGFDGNHMQYGR